MTSSPVSILMIEDDPSLADLTCSLLAARKDRRFICSSAATLAAGLHRLEEQSFQLVLLDLTLPDSQGLATLQRVIRRAPETAVVIFTGYDDEALAIKALQCGAQEYLVKGRSDVKVLVRAILHAIERKQMAAEIKLQQE